MKKNIVCGFGVLFAVAALADSDTIIGAVTNGTVKGTVGTYMEYRDMASGGDDSGWGTGYLYLKVESDRYMRTKVGVSVLGHTRLWDHSAGSKDAYKADIEKRIAVPELYLDIGLTDESRTTLRLGRWANKGTHIDDSHSEGFYIDSREWENFSLRAGGFRSFAELDYDDGEDFGRNNQSQSLGDDATFGPAARSYAFFAEGHADWKNMSLNPYLYYHDGYATVYGMDTKTKWDVADDVTVGLRADGYYVDADESIGVKDGQAGTLAPFICSGPFTFTVGMIQMGGSENDPALNRPLWFKDYLLPSDQVLPFSNQASMQDLSTIYTKLRYDLGAFWTHILVSESSYDSSKFGTASRELEFQVGYVFESGFDINLRLFDVEFDGAGGSAVDYQKVEFCSRYCF